VGAKASRREIERAYKCQRKRAHPDHGGSVEWAAALNAARDALLRRR
jgi:DnaJ-class molecular chaperone